MASTQKRQRIRVCLKAYEHKLVDLSAEKIVETAKRTDAKVAGPIPLPTNTKKFTVIRSPHIYKRSMEQYEIKSIKRLLIIIPTPQTVNALMSLNLSAGVDIKIALNGVNE